MKSAAPITARAGASRPNEVRALFAELEKQAEGRLRGWFNGPIRIERSAEMRYGEQIFEIDVPLDGLDWNSPSLVDAIEDRFHRRHEELYTYASRGQEVVFVNARVAAVGEVAQRGEGAKAATQASACKPMRNAQGVLRRLARYRRSMPSTSCSPATRSKARRSSKPRPRRCWSTPATASASMRSAGWILRCARKLVFGR